MKRMALLLTAALSWSSAPAEAALGRLAHARYVAIVFNVGSGVLPESTVSQEVLPEEREAARRIRAALQAGERFVLVERPERADLLISIRKGRHGSVGADTRTAAGVPPTGGPAQAPAPVFGLQFSSPDDLLEILDPAGGDLIWRATKPNGLLGNPPPLFQALQAEVTKADAVAKKP
jgi:hypothetical protein